jgi:hypothetical protein
MVRDQLRRMALVGGEGLSLLWRYGWVVVIDEGGRLTDPVLVRLVVWWRVYFGGQTFFRGRSGSGQWWRRLSVPMRLERTFPAAGMQLWNAIIPGVHPPSSL